MKLALAFGVLALAGAAPQAQVLGFDYGAKRISWYVPGTLAQGRSGAMPWNRSLCSWSLAPKAQQLALSDCNGTVRFVALPSLKILGSIGPDTVGSAAALAWVTPRRLLMVERAGGGVATLAVADTDARRVVRRVDLGGVVLGRAVVGKRLVLLLAPWNTFGPARVVAIDGDGNLASAAIDDITAGSHFGDPTEGGPGGEIRTPGFAVDPAGTAFVIGPDLRVAAVDLATMHVGYHGPTRAPAKVVNGATRVAAWLGAGKVAVSGVDHASSGKGRDLRVTTTPFGLHLLDTSTWTYRTLTTTAVGLIAAGRTVLGTAPGSFGAYSATGAHLYDLPVSDGNWVSATGKYGYVCNDRRLARSIDLATGADVTTPTSNSRACPTLLAGRASQF